MISTCGGKAFRWGLETTVTQKEGRIQPYSAFIFVQMYIIHTVVIIISKVNAV